MNLKISIVFLLFLLIGCKKNTNTKKQTQAVNTQQVNKVKQTTIPIHTIVYDSVTTITFQEKISNITQKLQPNFLANSFNEDSNALDNILEGYESKSFLNILAESFKNDNFLDVKLNNVSFVVPNKKQKSDYISIEEWFFSDKSKAKSCFESLKTYKERSIYFKRINWIWVYQENKIYLVFARNLMVTDPEMQSIKKAIIETVSTFGDYETLQFYE